MTYPQPNPLPRNTSIQINMSTMCALQLLKVLKKTKCEDSSENAHVQMTISKLEEALNISSTENHS